MRHLLSSFAMAALMMNLLTPPASGGGRQAAAPSQDGSVVFQAHDYGFDGPDSLPAGLTTIRVMNEGHDFHHIQVLKLLQGKSAEDFRAAVAADPSRLPRWVKFVGGPNAAMPGHAASATINLTDGNHVLICLIPDSKGVLHVALGMQKAISVRGGKLTKVSEPRPTATITQADFHFSIGKASKSGLQTVAVTNHGTQPHEVVLVRLTSGSSATDFIASVEPGSFGPPRGLLIGGIAGIEPGEQGFFTADFTPGRYALVCFFPDVATGRPHYSHGMTAEFSVH